MAAATPLNKMPERICDADFSEPVAFPSFSRFLFHFRRRRCLLPRHAALIRIHILRLFSFSPPPRRRRCLNEGRPDHISHAIILFDIFTEIARIFSFIACFAAARPPRFIHECPFSLFSPFLFFFIFTPEHTCRTPPYADAPRF